MAVANGQGADLEGKAQIYKDRADAIQTVNLSLVGAFIAVAAVGIVQANLAYVPEVSEVKKRELPPQTRVVPLIAPLARSTNESQGGAAPSGALLGVSGTF